MELSIPSPHGSVRVDSVTRHISGKLKAARAEEKRYLLAHATLGISVGAGLRLWNLLLERHLGTAPPDQTERVLERYFDLMEQDLANARAGYYPEGLVHDFPLLTYARVAPELALEGLRILRRKHRNDFLELPPEAADPRYPDYYRRTFHWQADGWLSERSARLYDASVEILFLGLADVMRRMVIPPVVDATRALPAPRILDLASGTGRFLRQLHRALPAARLTALDLSAPYLEKAKENLAGAGADLVVANAEAVPLEGESFDAVTSIFLFHELPRDARRNVAREALRLLRPGGTVVLCDSAQLSDSGDVAFYLDAFPRLYHEPYYKGYLRDDLGELLREAGFTDVETRTHYVAKVVVGRKPSLPAAAAAA